MPESLKVTLLTQPDCRWCEDAKALLDRLAREYPMTIESLELASAEGEQAAGGAILFAPGILLDGEPLCYGRPSERKLRHALAAHATTH